MTLSEQMGTMVAPTPHGRAKILLPSARVGELTVLGGPFIQKPKGHHVYLCKCSCGSLKIVPRKYMDRVVSCGCAREKHRRDILRAGFKWTPSIRRTFLIWRTMHARCSNKNTESFHRYGGRGIKVCRRWFRFVNFLRDMGCHRIGLSIDRADNNGPYSPSNCRWATKRQQAGNTSRNRRILFDGKLMNLVDWAIFTGIKASTIARRLHVNWPISRALTQAVR